ncbi:cytochrome ubiquinol oxidase subunit I [Vulgatibacter sp.]|uniref:cytochrome ubiquinol oxidase subunit I n=1 Tax=Vulgatibacter sp. TaxID=1971226 RepID=UPI0035670387
MDVVLLARLQFALTIMFHYLFPPLTIGLGVVIVYLIGMHLRTKQVIYDVAARFWTKVFALNFALGVATGIVMEFQFGTNWAVYSRYVGDVFGSALAAEGIFAFFLESGFLAVLVFGWDRVSPRMHFFAALMVAIGGIFSSIWITVANSWQQTPAGFAVRPYEVNGEIFHRAEIQDFWAMVFNPSTVDRLVHVWFGAFILGAFFVMSISAWYLLKGRHTDFARRSFSGGLLFGTIFSLAQLVSGHSNANMVAEHQPAKLAAMEGIYRAEAPADLHLFGWPNDETQRVEWGIALPGFLSFLIHNDFETEVKGLAELEEVYGRPPVWLTFQAYHLMVACGMFFIAITLLGTFFRWRGTLFEQRWLLWLFVPAVVLAFAANELGWVAAEVGRQPWTVYPSWQNGEFVQGLRTADSVSESVVAGQVLGSIIGFGIIYALLFALWIFLLNHKIQHGPELPHHKEKTSLEDYLETAAHRAGHEESFTEPKMGG